MPLNDTETLIHHSGILVGAVLAKAFGHLSNSYAYRGPFALQWLFPAVLLIGLPFCPESPWWLVRNDKWQAAGRSLQRLGEDNISQTLATIKRSIHQEHVDQKDASYMDCFRGVDLRRTEIGIVLTVESGWT